jgi:hypothetical protein
VDIERQASTAGERDENVMPALGNVPPLPEHHPAVGTLRRMKMLRRALVALSFAGTIAGVLRLRGKGGVPPQEGGWREVSVPPR